MKIIKTKTHNKVHVDYKAEKKFNLKPVIVSSDEDYYTDINGVQYVKSVFNSLWNGVKGIVLPKSTKEIINNRESSIRRSSLKRH